MINIREIAIKIETAVNEGGVESVEDILRPLLSVHILEGIENTHVDITEEGGIIIKPNKNERD